MGDRIAEKPIASTLTGPVSVGQPEERSRAPPALYAATADVDGDDPDGFLHGVAAADVSAAKLVVATGLDTVEATDSGPGRAILAERVYGAIPR